MNDFLDSLVIERIYKFGENIMKLKKKKSLNVTADILKLRERILDCFGGYHTGIVLTS